MTFTPTPAPQSGDKSYPGPCFCCGRHATGVGIGRPPADPKWLCQECSLLMQQIREIRNFSPYERAAVSRAVDAVGPFIERLGPDLSEWEEEDAEDFVRAIWQACGDELREVIKTEAVPF